MKGQESTAYLLLNPHTVPLSGSPAKSNAGVIKALGKYGEKYSVAKIEYQEFENREYQYIITPYWDVIDALDRKVFQGIPGIAMELRQKRYYRVNIQPVFIAERSPEREREDLWELMGAAGLDEYDRFEWLIRTPMRCSNDNLIVERYREGTKKFVYDPSGKFAEDLQYGDRVCVRNQCILSENPELYTEYLLRLLATGATVIFEEENLVLGSENRQSVMPVLRQQYYMAKTMRAKRHQKGVEAARNRGVYRGRKPIYIEEEKLRRIYELFHMKKITEVQAMRRLGITSRSTFYRKLKNVKKS